MRKRQWNCFMKCWSSDSFYGLHLLYTSADRFFFSLFVISNPLLENYIILLLCSLFSWVLSGFHLVLKVLVIFWVTVTRSQIKLSLNIPYFRSSKIISTNPRLNWMIQNIKLIWINMNKKTTPKTMKQKKITNVT